MGAAVLPSCWRCHAVIADQYIFAPPPRDSSQPVQWYTLHPLFIEILKPGCKIEDSKLRTKERLTNLIAVCCIVSWRIFWLNMINRAAAKADPKIALTKIEIEVLDRRVRDKTNKQL